MNNFKLTLLLAGILGYMATFGSSWAASPSMKKMGNVTEYTVPIERRKHDLIDFANDFPLPLPKPANITGALAPAGSTAVDFPGVPSFSKGYVGTGVKNPVSIPKSRFTGGNQGIIPRQFGTLKHPFTTSRVDAQGSQVSSKYPFSATGKLYIYTGGVLQGTCSASLIKKGLLVTAAHCVANYGQDTFYDDWAYVPAKDDNFALNAPYGTWDSVNAWVMNSYLSGTGCDSSGVVCNNDIGVIKLAPKGGVYPGTQTGYYGYATNGFGFTNFLGKKAAQITQLGYPGGLDDGGVMQRTDSLGYVNNSITGFNNTLIGSRQNGGSSGGPWLVNLGIAPNATGANVGTASDGNTVIGVTSWGYTSDLQKQMGASPFTNSNLSVLITSACSNPSGC